MTLHAAARTPRVLRAILGIVSLAVVAAGTALAASEPAAPATSWPGLFDREQRPRAAADLDIRAVELGVRFSTRAAVQVIGVRFYKFPTNSGIHRASLWSPSGNLLRRTTFTGETRSGWQSVFFKRPLRLRTGLTYTASYSAPRGRYADDTGFFATRYRRGDLTVPADGGVYTYVVGARPRRVYRHSNYYVDVLIRRGVTAPIPKPTKAPNPEPTKARPTAPAPPSLHLPRIPWEGGSAYYGRFRKAAAAGWTSRDFFPIVLFYGGISNDAEAGFDKSIGINTYTGMWEGTPYRLFRDNGLFWVGGKLNSSFTDASVNWVGDFLDDEVDGRFSPAQGRAHLRKLVDRYGNDGRIKYANFTQIVMGTDMSAADAEAYVNDFTDVVSLDMYWYTVPYCSIQPYRDVYLVPIAQQYCRTASSYGKAVRSLRIRDTADGKLQPMWQFVELLNGGPGGGPFTANMTPGELRGAVMNSIINEARGIVYFNQSLNGPCQSGNIIRTAQLHPKSCVVPVVLAAKKVDAQIRQLASVLNSQSFRYSFGPGLNTMLKAKDGYCYIFAMVDGSSTPGRRGFQLPADVRGRTIKVMFEHRSIAAHQDGRFTDDFSHEYTYHVYRVRI